MRVLLSINDLLSNLYSPNLISQDTVEKPFNFSTTQFPYHPKRE